MPQQPRKRPATYHEHVVASYHRRHQQRMEEVPQKSEPVPEVSPPVPVTSAKKHGRKTYKRRTTTGRRAQAKVQSRDSAGRFSFGEIKNFVTAKKLRENIKANVRLSRQGARENSPILRGAGTSKKPVRRRRVVRRGTSERPHKPTQREIQQFHKEHERRVRDRWGVLGMLARRIIGRGEE